MNVRKRGLALLMCICMIFTLLPFSALADATGTVNAPKKPGTPSPLKIEYWCTNKQVYSNSVIYKKHTPSTEHPEYLTNIAPDTASLDSRSFVYWKTVVLPDGYHQTTANQDNKSNHPKAKEISAIRNVDGKNVYYTVADQNTANEFLKNDQIVAYYKQVNLSTNYGKITASDWGDNQYSNDAPLKVTYKIVDGVTQQFSTDLFYNKVDGTIKNIGLMPAAGYEVYKVKVDNTEYTTGDYLTGDTLTLNRDKDHTVTYYIREIQKLTVTYEWLDAPSVVTLPVDSNEYKKNDTVTVNTDFTKDYEKQDGGYTYTFSGWFLDNAYTTSAGGSFIITKPTTLYGYWTKTANEYSVTYTVTGKAPTGYTVPTGGKVAYGEKIDVADVPGANDYPGYTFSGWTTTDVTADADGNYIMPAKNVTFTGHWTEKDKYSYTVKAYWIGDKDETTGKPKADANPFAYAPSESEYYEGTPVTVQTINREFTNGYTLIGDDQQTITIISGENVAYFYYYKNVTLTANSSLDNVYDGTQKRVSGFTGAPDDADFSSITVGAQGTNAGTYPANFADGTVGTVDETGKYIVVETTNGSLEIAHKNVTVTAQDKSKFVGENDPAFTVTIDGLVDGESEELIKYTITRDPGEEEGYYPITPTGEQRQGNYNVDYRMGMLTIKDRSAKEITLTATKLLDDNNATGSNFEFELYQIVNGKEVPIRTVHNDNEAIKFTISVNKAGTFTYYIREVTKNSTYVVCDGTVYAAEVTVKPSGNSYTSEVKYYFVQGNEQLPTDEAVFRNESVGVLEISKKVAGNAASEDQEFTFIVTLQEALPTRAAANSNITAIDYTAKDKAHYSDLRAEAENGRVAIKISLKDGETFTINGLPDGIRYTVQELDNNGYTVTVNGENTTLATGTIAAGKTSTAAFKNTKNYVYPVNPPIMDEITVEITGNSDSVVYDGTEHSVKDYTVKISDPRYTEADFTFTGKAEASGVNAGTYEMGLKAEQFKNTNARFTNVKFVIKADGVLTITPKDLTITAGSKTEYGPTPVTCDEWTVSGLAAGDKVESVKITGIQSVPGSSPNVPSDAVIKNAKGEDVTKNYAIKYVNGTLTMLEVLNKEDHFNYIIGTPEGLSLPTANVTRAEVATIFFRLMTDDARAKFDSLDNNFSDVAKGQWYNRAISTLANAGIIKGDPAGTYRPGDAITRAEMAAIIARFGDFKEGGKTFNDISGHWAQKYIELAASNGWINGNPDGTFKPNNNITRAETVAMINRVLDRQTKDVSDLLPVSQMTNWSDNMDTAKWYYRDMQEATNNHKAERVGNSIYEKWTEKLPDIDWASYQI